MEFEPITTQEKLDAIIEERMRQEDIPTADEIKTLRATADRVPELENQNKTLTAESVKTRIAHKVGLPYELAGRLSGEDEEAILKDAQNLFKMIGHNKPVPPLASNEGGADDKDAALRQVVRNLNKKGE